MPLGACLACGGDRIKSVADLGESPVATGALFDNRASARQAACGRLEIGMCLDCTHVQNLAFDARLVDYDVTYDNSLHFSGTFQEYADELVARLVDQYDIRGKRIIEIGSGKGDFLQSICAVGGNTGTGFDPSVEPGTEIPGVRLVRDYFRPVPHPEPYDVLACRHVLEHLDDPATLLRALSASAPPDALHYFEVPAAEFNFGPDGLWDCIYPHVSYFSQGSLASLVQRCGFEIVSLMRSFHGQFLSAEVRTGRNTSATQHETGAHLTRVKRFAERYEKAVARWRADVRAARDAGETIVVWGAGSKGVNFLNAVDVTGDLLAVDINPRKWGKYLPISGHEVLAPQALAQRDVSTVVITNPAYRNEIADTLDELGSSARIVSVHE
ncbi:MAG TPA: methyltransferase domain-containing protein [Jiangellaceae bacterium]